MLLKLVPASDPDNLFSLASLLGVRPSTALQVSGRAPQFDLHINSSIALPSLKAALGETGRLLSCGIMRSLSALLFHTGLE